MELNFLASIFTDATGLSGPALAVLGVAALAAVLAVAYVFNKRRRR